MDSVESQIRELVRGVTPFVIVQDPRFLYFPLSTTQEEVSFKRLPGSNLLPAFECRNYKGAIIGYGVELSTRPKPFLEIAEFGAAIFFGKGERYKTIKVVFHDQRFRIVQHGEKDFWVSVKWKSPGAKEKDAE